MNILKSFYSALGHYGEIIINQQIELFRLRAENQNLKNALVCKDYVPKSCLKWALDNIKDDSAILCISESESLFRASHD